MSRSPPRIVEVSSSDEESDFVSGSDEDKPEIVFVEATAATESGPEVVKRTLKEQQETEESIQVYFDTYRMSLQDSLEETCVFLPSLMS
jgi:hypothetical protein